MLLHRPPSDVVASFALLRRLTGHFTFRRSLLLLPSVAYSCTMLLLFVLKNVTAFSAVAMGASYFLGLLGGILGIFAGSKGFSLLWPYALMQAGMNANKSADALAGSYGMFFLSCAFWLAAMFLLAWGLLRKRDVKA